MRTTLGQVETPLSVIGSMTVPSLVVGAAANNSAVKRPGFRSSDDVDRYAPVRFPMTKVGDMREMFEIRNPAEVPVSVRLAVAEDESSSWTEASPREESGHADPSVVLYQPNIQAPPVELSSQRGRWRWLLVLVVAFALLAAGLLASR